MVEFILMILTNNIFISLIINILVGLFVNKIYVMYAKKKIEKIKNANQDKNNAELDNICKSSGGTSVGSIFIGLLLMMVISGIISSILMFAFGFNVNNMISKYGINTQNGTNTEAEIIDDNDDYVNTYVPGVYSGELHFSSDVIMQDEFSITAPSAFVDDSYDSSYSYEYQAGDGIFNACRISMNVVEDFTSSEDLINQMSSYFKNDNATNPVNETINNINWSWFNYSNDIGIFYNYATVKNGKLFLLEYQVQSDTDSNCEKYRNEVINSIKSK